MLYWDLPCCFYPRKHVAFFGETVTFQILAEEVIDLSGAEFKIDYDPSMFQIESVTQGALFQSGTQSIFHVDYNNVQGSFSVLTAILDATTPSVDGNRSTCRSSSEIAQSRHKQLKFWQHQ